MTEPRREPTRYTAGEAYAVAASSGVALVAAAADAAVVEAVWQALADGGDLGAVLDAATGATGRFADAPPFALVVRAEPARVLVRGDVEAHVSDADGATRVLSGAGVATWSEHVLAGAREVSLRAGASAGVALPLVDGIVRAGGVTVVLAEAGGAAGVVHPAAVAAEPAAPVVTEVVASVPAAAAPVASSPAAAVAAQPQDVLQPAPAASVPGPAPLVEDVPAWVSGDVPEVPEASELPEVPEVPEVPEASELPDVPEAPDPPEASELPEVPDLPEASGEAPADGDALETVQSDSGRFAHLWGETVMASVAAAAVIQARDDAEGALPTPAAGAAVISDAEPPLMRGGDHDGATVSLAAARAMRAQRLGEVPPVPEPPAADPPASGRLELSTGRSVLLDRPVVVGRRPRAARVGDDVPQLVAVDSPSQDISRSHIEVRREGEAAVVVDLDTTNGTVLHREGANPTRLHPGEPTMLIDGDVLDLGDEVTVTYREA
ncbi:FHA domain-containing protein [Microbacterium sp. zg.Y625]|uniref:FHA domain-containing protein n=1 Tax=Microbacterium jiangjiandongii TaxID=3049071 RepID=UPI00214BFF42|nr:MULTISPECIES: FHA domain-containing protein [unclassified Microbacterium]MCR2794331.1 FHA domain-containing protein [Microbacterium sp. zg.Y625]WIM25622.1 FHA domain-containing protein [Microbacterium sp. zg-Y625]